MSLSVRLITRPQHDYARRSPGVVPSRIREVSIECDEHAALTLARLLNRSVRCRREPFLVNVVHVPSLRL